MRIGFIGLGKMGGPMARNLIDAGHSLVVHDLDPAAAAPHPERGASWADSPREVALASDVVLTSLPGPREVEQTALGEDGLIEGLAPGRSMWTPRPARLRWSGESPRESRLPAPIWWTHR